MPAQHACGRDGAIVESRESPASDVHIVHHAQSRVTSHES